MAKLARHSKREDLTPLTFQLSTTWEEAIPDERKTCIEKATKACEVICSVIAPKDGEKLFQAIHQPTANDLDEPTEDLIALMSTYRDAMKKNVKIQILSIYAYRYTMKLLQKFHKPYEKRETNKKGEIACKKTRAGSNAPKVFSHRVRLDTNKVDHFIDFVNRPYFYQDVAFGTRTLTLDGGGKITMPNVIRTVTRSTMIMHYLQHCEEESFEPASRSTHCRILEVREASQQKSLSGLDNIAAEGVASFERLLSILEELNQAGADKRRVTELAKKFNDGKRYLRTEFKVNCSAEESECADHCRTFALSDPVDPCFNHQCSHSHNMVCEQCEQLKATLDEMEESIKKHSSHLYSQEQKHDLLYDFERSKNCIFLWKSHALRSVNQESAKQEALQSLDSQSVLVVIDWAMKFLQMKYREKQSDQETQKAKVLSYAHLLDLCCQDWYSVVSI